METHPVPKNVLSVEFKLFGTLTAKQFAKLVGASMLGLLIFAIPLPKIITLPLALIVVSVGVLSALVKDFEVKMWALLRAVFIAPRYVWKKEQKTPESLMASSPKPAVSTATKISKRSAASSDDMEIDQLLAARASSMPTLPTNASETPQSQPEENFDRIYNETFGTSTLKQSTQQRQGAEIGNPAPQPVLNNSPRASLTLEGQNLSVTEEEKQKLMQQYASQINELKSKQAAAPEEQQPALTEQINGIYTKMKGLVGPMQTKTGEIVAKEKTIYGVVVSKSNVPIPDVEIKITDKEHNLLAPASISSADGRFAVNTAHLDDGEYRAILVHPKFTFHEFVIKLESGKLPAYKFRAD